MGYEALRGELVAWSRSSVWIAGLPLDVLLLGLFQEAQDGQEWLLMRAGGSGRCSCRLTSKVAEAQEGKKQSPPSLGEPRGPR